MRRLIPALILTFLPLSLVGASPPSPRAPTEELPPGALARFGTTRLRHSTRLWSLAFAPDGKTLASADDAGVVRIWETASGRLIHDLPAGTGVWVRFTSDGKYLVCAGSESGICLRDAVTGKLLRRFEDHNGLGSGPDRARCPFGDGFMALSADGKILADPFEKEVILWDIATGKERRRLKGHEQQVLSVAFSPDGKLLAAGGTGNEPALLLWEVESGKEVGHIPSANFGNWSFALAFAPDGKTLASSGSSDTTLWEVATRKRPIKFPRGGRSIAYSPDGKLLAIADCSGGDDGSFIHLLDAAKGQEKRTLRGYTGNPINAIALTPDGKLLASGGPEGAIRLWDTGSGREVIHRPGHAVEIRAVAITPDGSRVATASGTDHTIRIWPASEGDPLLTIDIPCRIRNTWCQEGHGVVLTFEAEGKTILCDNQLFDAANGHPAAKLPRRAMALSPNGKLLAGLRMTSDRPDEGKVAVWDRTTGREMAHFAPFGQQLGHFIRLSRATFSPDSRMLAIGVANHHPLTRETPQDTVFLYDLATRKLACKFRPDSHGPAALAFSSDGALVATSGLAHEVVRLWNTTDGREVRKLIGREEHRHWMDPQPLAFAPSGKFLASLGNNHTVVLWETATGQEVHRLSGHRAAIHALVFSADGQRLLSAGADTTALLWSVAPPLPKKPLTAADADRLWQQLAKDDAASAYRAIWSLARQPEISLPVLRKQLHPLPEPDPRQIARLLADLDADEFAVRKAAFEKLKDLRSTAEPALRRALAGKPTLEARKRMKELLAHLSRQPIPTEELRQLRAVQALEWMQVPAAMGLLKRLADGGPGLRTTRDAQAALDRRNRR